MKEWIIKLGPIERTNHADKKTFSEDGVLLKVNETVKELMETAKPLIPLLQKGFAVPVGFGDPEVKEDPPEIEIITYKLSDGSWFSIANSGTFGYRLECKKR